MEILTNDLLNFLCLAQKVHFCDQISFCQTDTAYCIKLTADWYDEGRYTTQSVFISRNDNLSTWDEGDYEFWSMYRHLEDKYNKQLEIEVKERKRYELINRLTPEERELLGINL